MHVEQAIRTRRTIKAYGARPVARADLDELLELARWAPNHHLTQPWRFRVLGPRALAALKTVAGPAEATKLDRAPTLAVISARLTGDALTDAEDRHATACAVYIVLLAAHARGLGGYWRTPAILREPVGRQAVGLSDNEDFVALLHLGQARQDKEPPPRRAAEEYVTYLP